MKKYIFLFNIIIFYSFLLINIPISHSECDINTPILTESGCELKYCSKIDFDSKACVIDNSIAKTQWLNDIILFDFDKIRYGSFTLNSEGDMIYEGSTEEAKGIRVFYWLKKDGSFYFKNDIGEKKSTKIIIVKNDDGSFPLRYESSIASVSIDGNENYIFSISLWDTEVELYDFVNNNVSHIKTLNFIDYLIHSTVNTFIKIENGNTTEYLHTFVGQKKTDQRYKYFYLVSQAYYFNSSNMNNGYSIQNKITCTSNKTRIISSYKTSSYYIYFSINNNYYKIESYDNNFHSLTSYIINDLITYDELLFCKSIYMKNNLGVFAYYKNILDFSPRIRIIEINDNGLIFQEKFSFQLNYPRDFSTAPLLNDVIKIKDNRFCFISSSQNRENLYIILFDFYNNDKNIKERIYNIKFFDLYSYIIYREITSILYNDFLTLSMSVCRTYPCDEENVDSNFFSFLIIFGYINGTNSNVNISQYLSEFNDINKINGSNIIDDLLENINIDNNLFGYEYQKKIKLTDISDELIFYNIENDEKIKVNKGETLNYNYEISQNSSTIKMGNKTYYFEFQYIAQEPGFDRFNQYAIEIITIKAVGNSEDGNENFESQILYGKTIKIEFKLCYELCETCQYLGISENEQKCLTCYENYTLINGNCYLTENLPSTTLITTIPTTLPETTIITTIMATLPETTNKNNSICLSYYNSRYDNDCIELCSHKELLVDNCGIDSENLYTIIYNLIKNYIKNYNGVDNLVSLKI